MVKNTIILKAEGDLEDKALREWVSMIDTRLTTLNDRTKNHTLQIKDLTKKLDKSIKELEFLINELKEEEKDAAA